MKQFLSQIVISAFLLFFIIACSQSEKTEKENKEVEIKEDIYHPDINLKVNKVDCWVNYMPGGANRFHISGEVSLPSSYKYDLNFIKLAHVKIYQEKEVVFSIKPVVQINEKLSNNYQKLFLFSTLKGVMVNAAFDVNMPVDMEIIFEEGGSSYSYVVKNYKVEKVY